MRGARLIQAQQSHVVSAARGVFDYAMLKMAMMEAFPTVSALGHGAGSSSRGNSYGRSAKTYAVEDGESGDDTDTTESVRRPVACMGPRARIASFLEIFQF